MALAVLLMLGIVAVLGSTSAFSFVSNIVFHSYVIVLTIWRFLLQPVHAQIESATADHRRNIFKTVRNACAMIIQAAQLLVVIVYYLPTRVDEAFASMFASRSSESIGSETLVQANNDEQDEQVTQEKPSKCFARHRRRS